MWRALAAVIFLSSHSFTCALIASIFKPEQIIFTSPSNITKLLVHADYKDKIRLEAELPSIFFTLMDRRFEGGSCIYVLEDLAAYEILEGGRDSTLDYGSDQNVYFGGTDGVYIYDKESFSAKKLGPFRDDIIQLQKANGIDKIYYLTSSKKLFELESHGTIRTLVKAVSCTNQFVLDTSNNIYYVQCNRPYIMILKDNSFIPTRVHEDFLDITLIRPASVMDDSIPLLGDGTLHILSSNGSCEVKDFHFEEKPSAFSVDTTLYFVVALNGKMYEYNMMEVLLKSMYGLGAPWPPEVNKIIVSLIGSSKDVFASYKSPRN